MGRCPGAGGFGVQNRYYAEKTLHPDDLDLFSAAFSREALLAHFGLGQRQIIRRLQPLRRRLPHGGVHRRPDYSGG